MRKATDELAYVQKIVNYLCLCAQSKVDEKKCTVEYAKIFVEETDNASKEKTGKALKRTAIGNRWEKNRQAASYIFAFYESYSSVVNGAASIDQFVDMLEQLAINQQRLNQLLGHAAYAADILAKTAHNVRLKDFEDVQRVEPQCTTFNADELEMINRIDPMKLSKKDKQHYRPKTIPRS